jgi:2-keto-3-deoxy-6-phosphogluconate aldolase
MMAVHRLACTVLKEVPPVTVGAGTVITELGADDLDEDRAVLLVCHPDIHGVFAHLEAARLPHLSLVTDDDW